MVDVFPGIYMYLIIYAQFYRKSSQQLYSSGVEGVWLWLAASGDRRVSVWSADWSQDVCHLLDWLSFPGPSCAPNGTHLKAGNKVNIFFFGFLYDCIHTWSNLSVIHCVMYNSIHLLMLYY